MKAIINTIKIMAISLLISPNLADAQLVEVNDRFWVMSSSPSTKEGTSGFTNNPAVNALFSNYNVTKYEKALPFANTAALQNVYEISCNCNIDSLIVELESNFKSEFSATKRLDYENIALYDPADYMWYLTTQDTTGWLWHLKKIQADLAWDITLGDPNVKTAILDTDFDITHPDLAGQIVPPYDPYDNIPYDCNLIHGHGTAVASYVAGETTETGQSANGQLASVGFNTSMMGYKAWNGNYLARALHASSVMGANVLTSSAGGWTSCPDQSGIDELIVKEILDNGTTIVMPAGNGESGTHNFCSSIDPIYHSAFFPLSPYYDERIILVSSTGKDDKHQNGSNGTHSHYPDVDLCAPGYNTMSAQPTDCGANEWPYYGSSSGTSFATPIVAGVAALMYSVNPCMTPAWCQDILKNTTDPIVDAANYPNGVGTGRVNAYKAVKEAQNAHSTTLDLYIKDRPEDFGDEQYPYHWQADRDESVDIWVRNQQDGFENQVHQEPEYQSSSPVYVYVRVRNKSCVDASGNEDLSLYWSKASSWSSWPQNWDGTQPTIGDEIGSVNLGTLAAGKDTIIEFTWNILNPYIHQNWTSCLLARIENSPTDIITIHPNRLDDDVFFNNNIALRNVTVIDIAPGIAAPGRIDGIYFPHGKYIFVGNVQSHMEKVNLKFSVPQDSLEPSILKEAEVKIILDDAGWNLLQPHLINRPDIKILREKEILILADTVLIPNVEFPANTRIPIYVGFSFLIEKITEQQHFQYHVRQYLTSDNSLLGGVHFEVNRYERDPFKANAGDDKEIKAGESVAINAIPISESATYNWYDLEGNLIYEGTAFSIAPEVTRKYKLEVITDADGFKDYDEMEVKVNPFWIESISPNPASNQVNIGYVADQASSAYLMILNQTSTVSNNYIIDTNLLETSINLSTYQSGVYTLVLVCDGIARDAKNFVIQ
jgi:subtilisin family serine protease